MNPDYSVSVFAPATVSNVGPGFDFMGFALEQPGDIVTVSINPEHNEVKISGIEGDFGKLPRNPAQNTAGIPALKMFKDFGFLTGIDIHIKKQMGIGSGLGSSAASAVAVVVAINELMELELEKEQLLTYAAAGELAASGSIHYDNIAPCLYGGFVIVTGLPTQPVMQLKTDGGLYCAVIHPDIEIKTSDARRILPDTFSRSDAVTQARNAAALTLALKKKEYSLLQHLITDCIAEPYRAQLIPWYNTVREAAFTAGAFNCNISGSGPAMFAFAPDNISAERIGAAMRNIPETAGITTALYVSSVNTTGPEIL